MKPRTLIFDRDQAITQQLFWTLSDYYDVVTANDLHTALRRAATFEPRVAILELNAPARLGSTDTGWRILEYVKSRAPKCRILGVTSEVVQEIRNKYFLFGVDELLVKPFDTEQLLGLLRKLAPFRTLDALESGAFKLCY